MRYRVTCLTPTLVGDGRRLSPIDYMVWKDHVNVLDQWRIFRLLAKGPRLDNYLTQLKNADKLDFASWGGFAQNFAGRRLPFEHASSIPLYERALKISEKALGPNHPDVAENLNDLAKLYFKQGKYNEALPLYERALKITEKALGPDHPSVVRVRKNLSILQSKLSSST